MSLPIRCPNCKTVAQAPVELTGKAIRCRGCGSAVRVEAANVVKDVPVVSSLSDPPPDRRIQSSLPNAISPVNVAVIETRKPTNAAPRIAPPRRSAAPLILLVVIGVLMLLVGGAVVAAIAGVLLWSAPSPGPAAQAQASAPPAAAEPAARDIAEARPGPLSREMLDALKAATVYIKVDAGRVKGSGSGFLIKVEGDTGFIVTNEHVALPKVKVEVGPRMPFGPTFPRFGPRFGPGLPGMPEFPGFPDLPIDQPTQKLNANLTVVVGSGTANERSLPAELIVADESRDLAVLVVRAKDLPRPLALKTRPNVQETMPVFVLGFPFGEDLAFNRNPEVTIGPATVTSIRSDEKGKPAYVQLQGDMNPGNSGGPVVDSLGRLVGVSFAKVKGTQIGLAVSRQSFDEMFQEAKWRYRFKLLRSDRDQVEYRVEVLLIDLFEKVQEIQLVHAPGILATDVRPDAGGKFGPLPNARPIALAPNDGMLAGRLTANAHESVNDQVTLQIIYVWRDGTKSYSKPHGYHVAFAGRAPVADAPQPGPNQQPAATPPKRIVEAPLPSTPPEVSLPLAGPPKSIAIGGAGRFLILHLPSQKQLAIFDVKSARFAGNIPADDAATLFAAGREHLMIYAPTGNQFERWNLATLKREASSPNPIPAEIKALAMGSASSGPLVVFAPTQANQKPGLHLIDPLALKLAEDMVEPVNDHFDVQYKPQTFTFGVSPDGRHVLQRYVFDWWIISRAGLVWRGTKFGAGTPLPSADGQVLIDHGQAHSMDGKPLGAKRGGHGAAVWNIPAVSGGLSVSFNEVYAPGAKDAHLKIMFHVGGEPEPLATFPRSLPDSRELVDWVMGRPRPFERHVFFAPDLGALVYIPWKKNHIDVYRVDLDQLLKDSKRDYLFVLSQPATEAQKGSSYRYPIVVKSKKGGVKFELQTGPPGMTVAADGTLAWTPPANFADRDADVAVLIRDAAGQEIRHEFRIAVRDKQQF